MNGKQAAHFIGVCTLSVASICATLPAPGALAATGSTLLLAQAYPPPPPEAAPPPAYLAPAAPDEAAMATRAGQTDAAAQISGVAWFFAGFFLSWIGIILGYALTPSIDGARLIGKSPGYVAAYSDAYVIGGRSFQGIHAVYGCVTSGAIVVVVSIVLLVLASLGSALGGIGAAGA